MEKTFASVEKTISSLSRCCYIAPRPLAVAVFLASTMQRPLFLEGEPGVGKTALAKAIAQAQNRPLLRLQCYEGIDASAAVYDWNYPKQMLCARMDKDSIRNFYSEEFLLKRPLLQALMPSENERTPVLLIDEIDRADSAFEAFLLEFLSEWQISIPEYGTIHAQEIPITILTSNQTREVHDALKRRCFYHWLHFPSASEEINIIRLHYPSIEEELALTIIDFVHRLRTLDLYKLPGIAETIEWAYAITHLKQKALNPQVIEETLGVLLKHQDDFKAVHQHGIESLLS